MFEVFSIWNEVPSKVLGNDAVDILNNKHHFSQKLMAPSLQGPLRREVDLRDKVMFISQHSVHPNPNESCARTCQLILGLFNPHGSAGSITRQWIVARSDSTLKNLETLSSAKDGIDYINQQLDLGSPVMVGVNHTLTEIRTKVVDGKIVKEKVKKGQANGEDADHFVVIVGRGNDKIKYKEFFLYYEVAYKQKDWELGFDIEKNTLYIQEDFSLKGIDWKGRNITVTGIRIN